MGAVATCNSYNFTTRWGTYGTADGQFTYARTGTIKGDNIYITDPMSNRVQQFQLNTTTGGGTFVAKYGSAGTGPGQFNAVVKVAFDPQGNAYVTDSANGRVQKFSVSGTTWTFLYQIPVSPTPLGLATDQNGNVYVGTDAAGVVKKYSPTGTLLATWTGAGTTNGTFYIVPDIATYGDFVYVLDQHGTSTDLVRKFNSAGTQLLSWGAYGTGNGQFKVPYGISTDSNGYVYVADSYNARVQKFSPDGVYVTQFGNTETVADDKLSLPISVSFDSLGKVYVTDNAISNTTRNRVFVYSCAALTPPAPPPYTYLLYPIADTYVDQNRSSQNFGTSLNLYVDDDPDRITYLKFDLKPLVGKVITKATLRIRVTDATAAQRNVKRVSNTSWGENTMTFSNRPSLGTTVISWVGSTPVGVWVDLDVTPAIKEKLGSLLSLALHSSSQFKFGIASRESALVTDRPQLYIK